MILHTSIGAEELSTETIAALKSRFPTKGVEKELHAMHLWLLRYPKRRPCNVWRFVDNWLRKSPNVVRPPATTMFGWWTSDERTINQGHAVGIAARPGESMSQLRDRISAKLANG